MSLNITRRLGEGFILRNKAKSIFKQQGSLRLELQQSIRNKSGTFYQVSVKSDADSIVLTTSNEEVVIPKNETHIISIAAGQSFYIVDEYERWLDSSITFKSASSNQVKVSIDALSNVNIVRDELLATSA